MNKFEHLL